MDMMTLRQSRSSRGEKWWRSDPRYILNMEPGEFPNGSTVRCEKKKSEGLEGQSDSEPKWGLSDARRRKGRRGESQVWTCCLDFSFGHPVDMLTRHMSWRFREEVEWRYKFRS